MIHARITARNRFELRVSSKVRVSYSGVFLINICSQTRVPQHLRAPWGGVHTHLKSLNQAKEDNCSDTILDIEELLNTGLLFHSFPRLLVSKGAYF